MEPVQAFNLSSASFSRSFFMAAARGVTFPPACRAQPLRNKASGLCCMTGERGKAEQALGQNKCQVWKELGRGCLPVCKGESRLLFILLLSQLLTESASKPGELMTVLLGEKHTEFQTRLLMKVWTVVCSSTGNGVYLYPETSRCKPIFLGAFSKLFILK